MSAVGGSALLRLLFFAKGVVAHPAVEWLHAAEDSGAILG